MKGRPIEDWGPSGDLLPVNFSGTKDYLSELKTKRARAKTASSLSSKAESKPPIVYSSVFKPKPEQKHICDLATQHRQKLTNSEWALLDTLEVSLYNSERDKVTQVKQLKATQQRAFLEMQFTERQQKEEELKRRALADDAALMAKIAQLQAEEKIKLEAQREANIKAKNDKLQMLDATRRLAAELNLAKKDEERKMLARIEEELRKEKIRKEEKVIREKEYNERTLKENEVKIAAKKEEQKRLKVLESDLMKETLATLEKQDRAREAQLTEFHDMIQRRAMGAGQKAVEENKERLEREERLMKEREIKIEIEAQAKEERARLKKEALKAQMLESREKALEEKARKIAAAQEEKRRQREEAQIKAQEEKEREDRKMAAIRACARDNFNFLSTQTLQRELKSIDDGTGMTEAEKRINARLLEQAVRMVGNPHPITMKHL